MFDFSKIEKPEAINKEFVLSKASDAAIFFYYFGNFKIGDIYHSKFRKDKNPSTGFYLSKSGKLIYNDIATGEKLDCFAYVAKLYNCSFADAVKQIANDFNMVPGGIKNVKALQAMADVENFDRDYKKETKIHFSANKWDSSNLPFWNIYHITKEHLKKNQFIYPIKKLYVNNKLILNSTNANRYALTVMHEGEMLTKVYTPEESNRKWISNIPLDVPFGKENLKHKENKSFGGKAAKDLLIIQMFINECYATQNESKSAFSKEFISELNYYYDDNWLGWDIDETGLRAMNEMKEEGFKPCHAPFHFLENGIKDISDISKYGGLKSVEKLFKKYKII